MKLSYQDYKKKVKGCYLGKTIGGTLGAPFECFRGVYNIDDFMQDVSMPVPNDDVDLQLVWLAAVEREGKNIDSYVLAEYWENYVSAVISEYGTGKNNYSMGIAPPLSGHMRNENKDSNGAWIRTEIWACLCAGNPALAVNYAYYDACVDHSGEGIYAAAFMAAVEAAAFFETDTDTLIDIGLSYIPEDCAVAGAVRMVRQCFAGGDTWQQARKKLLCAYPSSFGEIGGPWKGTALVPAGEKCPVQEEEQDIPKAEHGFDAPASIGIVLIGWLYGAGDFGRSICLATNCGEDTDCTAGTVGALLGIIGGVERIPERWAKGCSDKIVTCTLRPDLLLNVPQDVDALCRRIVRQAPVILGDHLELTEDGFVIESNNSLSYRAEEFYPYQQEDCMELLAEQPNTLRRHFRTMTVKVAFDEDLARIEEGREKRLVVTLCNNLYLPQYLRVKVRDMPQEWQIKGGCERCVGLEHWHGSHNDNSFELVFTPLELKKGSYTLVLEITANGRGERNYLPLTLINGAC